MSVTQTCTTPALNPISSRATKPVGDTIADNIAMPAALKLVSRWLNTEDGEMAG